MEMSTSFWVILFILVMLFQLIGLIIMKLNCSPILKLYAFFWPNKRSLQNKTVWLVGASTGSLLCTITNHISLKNESIDFLSSF